MCVAGVRPYRICLPPTPLSPSEPVSLGAFRAQPPPLGVPPPRVASSRPSSCTVPRAARQSAAPPLRLCEPAVPPLVLLPDRPVQRRRPRRHAVPFRPCALPVCYEVRHFPLPRASPFHFVVSFNLCPLPLWLRRAVGLLRRVIVLLASLLSTGACAALALLLRTPSPCVLRHRALSPVVRLRSALFSTQHRRAYRHCRGLVSRLVDLRFFTSHIR
jgi:hypothetical protein